MPTELPGRVSAVGIVTADSSRDFDEFARGRQLGSATIVLDSCRCSVNDPIALRRRWRNLGVLTTVGVSVETNTTQSAPPNVTPVAYCESMCVFLLLWGKTRYVPETAHVRVHQIWMATLIVGLIVGESPRGFALESPNFKLRHYPLETP